MNLRRPRFWIAAALVAMVATIWLGNTVFIALESKSPSISRGTPARGSLRLGKRLPTSGPNYRAYSRLGALLGRNTVHEAVRAIVLDAYSDVAKSRPELRFVYGETGGPAGGQFAPHRTHQNGMSVDFMVPVRNERGRPVDLPTWPWQGFGYGLDFDSAGRHGDLTIDFDALSVHLEALDASARRHGSRIALLILAPEYYERLWATDAGARFRGRIPILARPAWVRHDEHYHVDFAPTASDNGARAATTDHRP